MGLFSALLISKDFFEADATDGTYLQQSGQVEFLLVTENHVATGLAGHAFVSEADDVVECALRS